MWNLSFPRRRESIFSCTVILAKASRCPQGTPPFDSAQGDVGGNVQDDVVGKVRMTFRQDRRDPASRGLRYILREQRTEFLVLANDLYDFLACGFDI